MKLVCWFEKYKWISNYHIKQIYEAIALKYYIYNRLFRTVPTSGLSQLKYYFCRKSFRTFGLSRLPD